MDSKLIARTGAKSVAQSAVWALSFTPGHETRFTLQRVANSVAALNLELSRHRKMAWKNCMASIRVGSKSDGVNSRRVGTAAVNIASVSNYEIEVVKTKE